MEQVIVFATHFLNEEIINRYLKIKHECSDRFSVILFFYTKNMEGGNAFIKCLDVGDIMIVNPSNIRELGYFSLFKNSIRGSVNHLLQYYYLKNPKYDYYWLVEYDVVFTGLWSYFFNILSRYSADFIGGHVEHYNIDNSSWTWWNKTRWVSIPFLLNELIKSFNPIFRLSSKALRYLDSYLRMGNIAHYEVLIPTALYHAGFSLMDYGGTGLFTPIDLKNKLYIQGHGINNGTLRWRPIFLKEEVLLLNTKNVVFHPVK